MEVQVVIGECFMATTLKKGTLPMEGAFSPILISSLRYQVMGF